MPALALNTHMVLEKLTLEIPGGSIDPFLTLKSDKNETSYYFRSKVL